MNFILITQEKKIEKQEEKFKIYGISKQTLNPLRLHQRIRTQTRVLQKAIMFHFECRQGYK